MSVRVILKHKGGDLVSLAPEDTIQAAATLLAEKRIGAVLVLEADGKIAGVLSERDIVRGVAEQGDMCLKQTVSTLMTRRVITCSPDESVTEIMARFTDRRIRHLPVVENGRLAGIVSIGDVVKFRIAEAEQEAAALREYIATG